MIKYPWEVEIEEREADIARRAEKETVVEKNKYQSVARTAVEEIGTYGLEYWIYFQALRSLCGVFLLVSLLAAPKLACLLRGNAVRQQDPFALLARLSLGNLDADARLEFGSLDLDLQRSATLGLLDALQLAAILGFVAWFGLHRVPSLIRNPEIRSLSAADYAVAVGGLPRRLGDAQAHQRYDLELVKHFEAVLRELQGMDPNSLICEAALVRDFGGALYADKRRRHKEAQRRSLADDELPTAAPAQEQGLKDRERRLKLEVAALTGQIARQRMEETDRPVLGAYVIVSSEQERARLLREYRLSRLPLVGRLLQPARLRLGGTWPLRVGRAPEPADIVWAHVQCSRWRRRGARVLSLLAVAGLLAACAGASLAVWQGLLGLRGRSAAQCVAGDPPEKRFGLSGERLADCLTPPAEGSGGADAWERGCECVCGVPERWRTEASFCESLGSQEATLAVLACALLAEGFHRALASAVPPLVRNWRTMYSSSAELAMFVLTAAAHGLVPLAASAALVGQKYLARGAAERGLAEPLPWEVDRGWYLHGAPVAALWCLARWLSPPAFALAVKCGLRKQAYRMLIWERYASLVCLVGVTAALQPVLPYLAPLAFVGLCVRYWSEKWVFLRGLVVVRSDTPVRTTKRIVRAALLYLWVGAAAGAALTLWTLGHPAVATGGLRRRDDDYVSRALAGPVVPTLLLLCLAAAAPLLAAVLWLLGFGAWGRCPCGPAAESVEAGVPRRGGQALSFQEAWLIMRHTEVLATYQMAECPAYRGSVVLEELQPDSDAPAARVLMNRSVDVTTSMANVGATAPSRPGAARKQVGAPAGRAPATERRETPNPLDKGNPLF